ncbi:hypothetical protein [Lentzea sp. NBRC 102530]|uniref:hypothetical protein n=1 Tax=Lentzea sp. NBRC 102530 TaxID=3032201 RepID=UPI0024A461C2|nr:hypothetical protein [Lentzea sp. NBRC 102530]GLY50463.1 hypothetical protein Lesp01_41190 [Lentzea sp. NBRC 102530]
MEHEETLRATFAKLRGETVPQPAHGAANVIRRGRAVRSRRRTAAVMGTAIATAAVAALALAFLPSAPTTPQPGAPVRPTQTTTPGVLTTPTDSPP